MKILFIHQNFPGQFVHLSADLAKDRKNQVVALSIHKLPAPAGVIVRHYTLLRTAASDTHPLLQDEESKVLRGEACAAAALQLKHEGFVPDVIMAHPGWGEALFIKDVFPRARLVIYCEFFYAPEGQDVGFDPETPPLTFTQRCRLRLRNTTNLHSIEIADAAISPTQWQRQTFPESAQRKITVIHDGIDRTRLKLDRRASITVAANAHHGQTELKAGDEILTYVARNLDPVRGFHRFMRTLPQVLRERPRAHALIVGGDGHGYGHAPPNGKTWRERLLTEVGDDLDTKRVHFVGQLAYGDYLRVLQISKVHTYWTTPFVLSWSFLEAATMGIPMVASATQPVLEFSNELGVETAGFFDSAGYAKKITEKLAARVKPMRPIDDERLDLSTCLKRQKQLLLSI